MKQYIVLFLIGSLLTSCGIKGDPVPPTKPFDWGQDQEAIHKKRDRTGEN